MTRKEKLLEQYSNYLKMRNYSIQTYKGYMGTVRNFWKFCEERRGKEGFDKDNAVRTYLAYRMDVQKRDFATVNGDYSALQWFYRHILDREWDVTKLVRPRKEARLPRYISPEQVAKLIGAAPSRKYRVMFLTYYSTGMRFSEVRTLKWENVSFEEGIIHVRKGKGAKDRMAILHGELAEVLTSYRQSLSPKQEHVFTGCDYRRPISATSVQRAFKQARRHAKLPEWVTAHVLRHSYATTILRNATDLLTLKELLGHRKLATTSQYLHLNIDHFKRSYNPLSNECLSASLQQSR